MAWIRFMVIYHLNSNEKHGNYVLFWTNPGSSTPRNSTFFSPDKPSNYDKQDMLGTAEEVGTNS